MPLEHLRCFIEHDGAYWKAYCVDVDLCATGSTSAQARAALDRLLERYCYERGDATPAGGAMPRAQLARRLKYSAARLLGHDSSAYTRHCYEFHAPPQLLVGLA